MRIDKIEFGEALSDGHEVRGEDVESSLSNLVLLELIQPDQGRDDLGRIVCTKVFDDVGIEIVPNRPFHYIYEISADLYIPPIDENWMTSGILFLTREILYTESLIKMKIGRIKPNEWAYGMHAIPSETGWKLTLEIGGVVT